MADSILVRFSDELASGMRKRAETQGKSMTAFINDAVRAYLKQLEDAAVVEEDEQRSAQARMRTLAVRVADLRDSIAEAAETEGNTNPLVRALSAIADCLELTPMEEPDVDPVMWRQFKYSKLNPTGDDEEARRMFASDYADIESRPWTWYRATADSDAEAKFRWLWQRRRYGLPLPPFKPET